MDAHTVSKDNYNSITTEAQANLNRLIVIRDLYGENMEINFEFFFFVMCL